MRDQLSISVIGMGYVGLPLLIAFKSNDGNLYGIEIVKEKLEKLRLNRSYIDDITDEDLAEANQRGIVYTDSYSEAIMNTDISIIAVPTPVDAYGIPNIDYIISSTHSIAEILVNKGGEKPHIIVLESTTFPTTTEVEMKSILLEHNLQEHKDFELAYSPERISPGDGHDLQDIPKIIGVDDDHTYEILHHVYEDIGGIPLVRASDPKTAELTKLFENIFRQVNIALVNELAVLSEKMQIDVYEVIDLASTKPFGFMPFYPGPGLGGHCIPVDPYYLSYVAKKFQSKTRFIDLSTEINDSMTEHVVNLVSRALNQVSRSIRDSKILICGYAYKPNVSDYRNSPAIPIIRKLEKLGAKILIDDQLVNDFYPDFNFVRVMEHLDEIDALLIVTPHKYFNWTKIQSEIEGNVPIIDTRGILDPSSYRDIDVGLGRNLNK